jgi:predicted ester cyclase
MIDAFGQGDKLVNHWGFKGRYTGTFFGIAPTGNDLDLLGTTIVTLVDGKIAKEDDFFCTKSVIDQLIESNV